MSKELKRLMIKTYDVLPPYECTTIVRISNEDKSKVEDLLRSNNTNHRFYGGSMEIFCEDEAQFRIRSILERDMSEAEALDIAFKNREWIGDALFNNSEFILDNDAIEDLVYECLYESGLGLGEEE